jgi:hypothetical protein
LLIDGLALGGTLGGTLLLAWRWRWGWRKGRFLLERFKLIVRLKFYDFLSPDRRVGWKRGRQHYIEQFRCQ